MQKVASQLFKPFHAFGEFSMRWFMEIGGLTLLMGQIFYNLLPWRLQLDGPETWRNMYRVGVKSFPIVVVTAILVGAIMVIQSGLYIEQYGAYGLLGWGAGYSILREVGPILIGLMFSGRVGANNTAELGTMKVTDQLDALRALAIEPVAHLAVPRVLSMVTMMSALYAVGCVFALAGGMLTAQGLIGVDFAVFWNSLTEYLGVVDFLNGWVKATAFGLLVGVVSCAFGFGTRGGAAGVGRAVNACVVASAVGIFVLDYFITVLWP